jgi:ribose/xylose/arabinose/galactoside ABC-type transport system permease subunit
LTRRRSRVDEVEIAFAGTDRRFDGGRAVGLFVVFSIVASGFLRVDNIVTLLRNVSVLGILAMAMAMVVVGRGIDLAMVATMVISSLLGSA